LTRDRCRRLQSWAYREVPLVQWPLSARGEPDERRCHPHHRATASAIPSYSRQTSSFGLMKDSCGVRRPRRWRRPGRVVGDEGPCLDAVGQVLPELGVLRRDPPDRRLERLGHADPRALGLRGRPPITAAESNRRGELLGDGVDLAPGPGGHKPLLRAVDRQAAQRSDACLPPQRRRLVGYWDGNYPNSCQGDCVGWAGPRDFGAAYYADGEKVYLGAEHSLFNYETKYGSHWYSSESDTLKAVFTAPDPDHPTNVYYGCSRVSADNGEIAPWASC
jgi:hypothetical protein